MTGARSMSRRGFTMLELTLAAMVGSLVLLAALGVFASLDRGDRALSARAIENNGLEQASAAIEKAIGTLVMETGGQVSKNARSVGSTPDGGNAGREVSPLTGRARLLLETDATAGLPGMPEVAQAKEGTAGAATPLLGTLSAPQRLELVLARHPAPVDLRPATVLTVADTGDAGPVSPSGDKPMAVRGSFDLRPERPRRGAEEGSTTWTLWWRPIERRVDDTGAEVFVGVDELAVPLATGLRCARWSVFYEEAWSPTHATAAVLDLPAYVKLQITTASGLEADWLFEVGWSIGPEFKPPPGSLDESEDESEEAGGAEVEGTVIEGTTATGGGAAGASPPRTTTNPVGPTRPTKPGTTKPLTKPGKPAGGAR